MWSFGDSTPLLQNVSLISAQTQQHSFASPGMYRVTVSTRNDAGLSEISVSVTVLGKSSERVCTCVLVSSEQS